MSDAESRVCPACGRAAEPEASFCEVCGADLHAKVAEVESHAEVAEAKAPAEVESRAESAKCAEAKAPAEVESRTALAKCAEAKVPAEVESRAECAECAEAKAPAEVESHAASAECTEAKAPAEVESRAAPAECAEQPVFDASSMLRPDLRDEIPFELEWDEAREFIESEMGTFSFRFRAWCDFSRVRLIALAGADPLFRKDLRDVSADGRWISCAPEYVPERNGRLSVRLRVVVCQRNGVTEETFESLEDFEHRIQPRDVMAYYGLGSFQPTIQNTIANEAGGSSGIVRNDGRYVQTVNIGVPGAVVDQAERQARVLDRRDSFRPVSFRFGGIARECAVIRSPSVQDSCELFVVPGADLLQFGRSHSAVNIRLVPEMEDFREDTLRKGYISNVHFSLRRDAVGQYVLRDGGSYKGEPWRSSTNGTCVDGVPLSGSAVLSPGRSATVALAPYAVSGGALSLTLEPRGWDDPAAAGCADRPGNLSSLLVRRGDNPHKAILVVWGAAELDPILGTRSGLRVASLRGRLHIADRAGHVRRLSRLAGRSLPGTSFTIS